MTIDNNEQADNEAYDDDGHEKRTGTLLTVSSHIITAVIGSGVLSLAWAFAQLGWVGGPTTLIVFSLITYMSSKMLASCYRAADNTRNYCYSEVVESYLGRKSVILCSFAQYLTCAGVTVGYTITASISMVAVFRSNCFHEKGHDAKCETTNIPYMAGFGVLQILLSQLPNFHKLSWLSIVAAIMSFSYASIGAGLAIAMVISSEYKGWRGCKDKINGNTNRSGLTSADKVWNACQAVGNLAFSYTFAMVLTEIRDTLKASPREKQVMEKAISIGVVVTTVFYLLCACMGYIAFGNNAPGNFLTDFGFYDPFWLVDFANVCVAIHLIGAYQVFAHPMFSFIELNCQKVWPKSDFINRDYPIKVLCWDGYPFNWFRLVYRTVYVIISVILAAMFPFFNAILGLIGSFAFFPLTVYFPIQMHIARKKIKRWSMKWTMLMLIVLVCFVVTFAGAIASIKGLTTAFNGSK